MIDFGTSYPDEEDIKLAFDRSMAIINEELQTLRDIIKRLLEGHSYVDADKCAEILHCTVESIPASLPYYRISRVGNKGTVYKLSEIHEFIEERRVPRK